MGHRYPSCHTSHIPIASHSQGDSLVEFICGRNLWQPLVPEGRQGTCSGKGCETLWGLWAIMLCDSCVSWCLFLLSLRSEKSNLDSPAWSQLFCTELTEKSITGV